MRAGDGRRFMGVITLIAGVVAGCSDPHPKGQVVRLGAVLDQTGSVARRQWVDSARLAVDHANAGLEAASGYRGLRFELALSDSNNYPEIATTRARELREQGVKGLVTDTTADTVAILSTNSDADTANDVALPVVCMACTAHSLGDPEATAPNLATQQALRNIDGWMFRTAADARPEARALIGAFINDLPTRGDTNGDGQQKIGVEVINSIEGRDFTEQLQQASEELFPGIIFEERTHERRIGVNSHNWDEDLSVLTNDRNEQRVGRLDGRPDALIEVTFPLFAAAFSRSYYEAGDEVSEIPFLHHHDWRNDQVLIKLGAFEVEGERGISHAILDNCKSSGRLFANAIEQRTGLPPGYLDAQTYDAVFSLALGTLVAIRDEGIDNPEKMVPTQLRRGLTRIGAKEDGTVEVVAGVEGFADAVRAVRDGMLPGGEACPDGACTIDYVGASGPVDFDEHGNVTGNFVKYEVQEGSFVDLETLDCVAKPASCPVRDKVCTP